MKLNIERNQTMRVNHCLLFVSGKSVGNEHHFDRHRASTGSRTGIGEVLCTRFVYARNVNHMISRDKHISTKGAIKRIKHARLALFHIPWLTRISPVE